ncbi:hypothetical protein WA158_002273 [Blastocystis sp. Blastoise]
MSVEIEEVKPIEVENDPITWNDVDSNEFNADELLDNDMANILQTHRDFDDPLKIVSTRVEAESDKTNYLSSEFEPLAYLSTVHKQTNFSQLQNGLQNLTSSVKDEQDSIKTLVSDNFGAFVHARDTIKILNTILSNKQAIQNGKIPLNEPVYQLNKIAENLIQPLQEQRTELTHLEEIQHLYTRCISSYSTTNDLYEYVKNRDYDKAIKEWNKLKQVNVEEPLLSDTIQKDISVAVKTLQDQLFKQLSLPNLPIHIIGPLMTYCLQLESPESPELYVLKIDLESWENKVQEIDKEFHKDLELHHIDLENYTCPQYSLLASLITDYTHKYKELLKTTLYTLYSIADHYYENQEKYSRGNDEVDVGKEITLIITKVIQLYVNTIDLYISYGHISSTDTTMSPENAKIFTGNYIFTKEGLLNVARDIHVDMSSFSKDGFIIPKIITTFSQKNLDILSMIVNNLLSLLETKILNMYLDIGFTALFKQVCNYSNESLLLPNSISMYMEDNKCWEVQQEMDHLYTIVKKYKEEFKEELIEHYTIFHKNIFNEIINKINQYTSTLTYGVDDICLFLRSAYTYKFIREYILLLHIEKYQLHYEEEYEKVMYLCEKLENKFLNIYIKSKVDLISSLLLDTINSEKWGTYNTLTMPRNNILNVIIELSVIVGNLYHTVHKDIVKEWKVPILTRVLEESITIVVPTLKRIHQYSDDGYIQLFCEFHVLRKALEPLAVYKAVDDLLSVINADHPMDLNSQQLAVIDGYIENTQKKMKHIYTSLL